MKQTALPALLLVVSLICGCKKAAVKTAADKPPEVRTESQAPIVEGQRTEPGPVAVATAPIHGPGPVASAVPPAPVVVPDSPDTAATLSQLSLELRKYVVRTRIAPKTFEEFIAVSQVQAPAPPPGKKYVIKSGAVVLAKL